MIELMCRVGGETGTYAVSGGKSVDWWPNILIFREM